MRETVRGTKEKKKRKIKIKEKRIGQSKRVNFKICFPFFLFFLFFFFSCLSFSCYIYWRLCVADSHTYCQFLTFALSSFAPTLTTPKNYKRKRIPSKLQNNLLLIFFSSQLSSCSYLPPLLRSCSASTSVLLPRAARSLYPRSPFRRPQLSWGYTPTLLPRQHSARGPMRDPPVNARPHSRPPL